MVADDRSSSSYSHLRPTALVTGASRGLGSSAGRLARPQRRSRGPGGTITRAARCGGPRDPSCGRRGLGHRGRPRGQAGDTSHSRGSSGSCRGHRSGDSQCRERWSRSRCECWQKPIASSSSWRWPPTSWDLFDSPRPWSARWCCEAAGLIVHVSSRRRAEAYAGWGAYGISKAGLEHLSRTWDTELAGTGVRSIVIDPGEMNTQMHAEALPDADRSTLLNPEVAANNVLAAIREASPYAWRAT